MISKEDKPGHYRWSPDPAVFGVIGEAYVKDVTNVDDHIIVTYPEPFGEDQQFAIQLESDLYQTLCEYKGPNMGTLDGVHFPVLFVDGPTRPKWTPLLGYQFHEMGDRALTTTGYHYVFNNKQTQYGVELTTISGLVAALGISFLSIIGEISWPMTVLLGSIVIGLVLTFLTVFLYQSMIRIPNVTTIDANQPHRSDRVVISRTGVNTDDSSMFDNTFGKFMGTTVT